MSIDNFSSAAALSRRRFLALAGGVTGAIAIARPAGALTRFPVKAPGRRSAETNLATYTNLQALGCVISIQEDFQFPTAVDERGQNIGSPFTVAGDQPVDGTASDMNGEVLPIHCCAKFLYMHHRHVRNKIAESIDVLDLPDHRLAPPDRIDDRTPYGIIDHSSE